MTDFMELESTYRQMVKASPKLEKLQVLLTALLEQGLLIAFSGGVDSSFLLWMAAAALRFGKLGKPGKLAALLTVSASVPPWEVNEAKTFAASIDVNLIVRYSQELQQEAYAKNDGSRCYYCKSELFAIAKEEANRLGYKHIAYGYNASDRKDVRFGHVAAKENNIHAPLDDAGLEKNDIRDALRQIDLAIADKPASPCLASRVMVGVRVTEERLHHIKTMEALLRDAGMHIYRVRIHEDHIEKEGAIMKIPYFRIEVAPEEMLSVLKLREHLVKEAQTLGYRWVNLDLSGYKQGGGTLTHG